MWNTRDLTNMRFGKLIALHPTDQRQYTNVVWECQCDCGKKVFVTATSLLKGHTKSCGCLRKKDLTGMRFGRLVALRPTEETHNGCVVWECQCDCGNTVSVPTKNLFNGQKKSCGCLSAEIQRDLTGMKFNRLTVLGSTEERKNKGTLWECRCDCGTIVKLLRYDITSGRVKSCGCLQREVSSELCKKRAKDITGQKFGKLTALRPTEERRATCTVWECRCDCGNTVLVAIQDLTSGHTRSCGCLTAESGAKRAKDLTGQRFGRLVALHPTDKRMGTYVVWECQCDCGNLTTAPSGDLLAGDRVSCGCILMENARRLNETQDRADGTNIDMLKTGKLRSNNRTGQTGVTITNTGKFQAYIGFQGKCYHLGFYKKLEDAVAVRKKAESLLHDETIDYYARWKEMAEKDPGWGWKNPIKITVEREESNVFNVSFDPKI